MIIRRSRTSVRVLSPNYLVGIGFVIMLAVVLVGGSSILLTGCSPADEKGKSEDKDKTDKASAEEADGVEMIKTPSGLEYQDLEVGEGPEAKVGDTAVVHYTGWLEDGTQFDTSLDKGQPYPVTLGQGRVIQGWEIGLRGMKAGGKRKLFIPPELGYGARDVGDGLIPPNSKLIFEVELLEIR